MMVDLQTGDAVHLKKWSNLKDGSQKITSDENVLVAAKNDRWITFLNLTRYYKDCEIESLGISWSFEKLTIVK